MKIEKKTHVELVKTQIASIVSDLPTFTFNHNSLNHVFLSRYFQAFPHCCIPTLSWPKHVSFNVFPTQKKSTFKLKMICVGKNPKHCFRMSEMGRADKLSPNIWNIFGTVVGSFNSFTTYVSHFLANFNGVWFCCCSFRCLRVAWTRTLYLKKLSWPTTLAVHSVSVEKQKSNF